LIRQLLCQKAFRQSSENSFIYRNLITPSTLFLLFLFKLHVMGLSEEILLTSTNAESISFDGFREEVLRDYRIVCISREVSLLGRKEVLTGKAKFGIFGDGKEVAQVAMAKVFQNGDFRSGYYRDQTFAFASGITTVEQWFAQLYAIPDVEKEPASGGRQMNCHFATRSLDENGNWKVLKSIKNSSADCSPTASQMPRALGLAWASKLYRENDVLKKENNFSENGNEICFATIGDSSTSEGLFWETLNAAGVLQVPLLISVWDDGYGISVPKKYQTTKESISEITKGFKDENGEGGIDIYEVKGWDYAALIETYQKATARMRATHIPALVHVQELTQPQGHSTSGSHERYKSKERLAWEKEFDCNLKMRDWMLQHAIADEEKLQEIETESKDFARNMQKKGWSDFITPIKNEISILSSLLDQAATQSSRSTEILDFKNKLTTIPDPMRRDLMSACKRVLWLLRDEDQSLKQPLIDWKNRFEEINKELYNSNIYSESKSSFSQIEEIKAEYTEEAPLLNGFEIVNHCFDAAFERDERLIAFGEDLGKIGDVNQGFSGLQLKYGESRIMDTGIREATIIGQAIGAALRGLRPIAEIQYLDYLLFALEPLSDDLATLHYRTKGGQIAPVIIRTRGHRLEGIWHSGSPMGMILNSLRGIQVLVPRNMTQASGFYNLLLKNDVPALVIECLNGYRLKEKLPANIGEFTVPFGVPEILREGNDVTLVTYGSCCRIADEAANLLSAMNISVEIIDAQTLLPFDIYHHISESIKKTNRLVVLDEDVPGGASAYILQQILEMQNAYRLLDSQPKTITANAHRAAYGSDGDYFSKPNVENVVETIYDLMHESDPEKYKRFF
jgi:2-oxoisovalerate dehydrogenase E1 component